ncbi:MAG: UDP-N-acetylmuramoyl-L-alanyl-D-glutamate--2,6-diaminopimelate ligase [Lachnospiraceae bacterium]|nr:UDP-N-acetylmuramoyl-L-alanyl-D-glutamate--2,6-diaminopimelate ligase [Lachnospiraceae bacterium]
MKLSKICSNLEYRCLKGSMETEVQDIVYDSRKIKEDVMFVCMTGARTDGHDYIPDAIEKGASVIVVEQESAAGQIPEHITVLAVSSTREALAFMSAAFFEYPARKLVTIGVTGTNGKTTTTHIIKSVLESSGKKTGLIGSNGATVGELHIPLKNTTPESYELHSLFHQMVDAGCECVVMEVSSQALKLGRTAGIQFDYSVFNNLSPDHIGPNEHDSFEEYLACKSLLFKQCRYGIFNADDSYYKEVSEGHTCQITTFSAAPESHAKANGSAKADNSFEADSHAETDIDLKAYNIENLNQNGRLGMQFHVQGILDGEYRIFLPGYFSVYNALAAMSVCRLMGIAPDTIRSGLEQAKVKGRMELLPVSKEYSMLIDYAHNRVSTENALNALQQYHPRRLVCVYGCGGNRSPLRRYDMGEITGKYADLCILTCDNPRYEELHDINEDIKVGLKKGGGKYIEIDDRKEAIAYSMSHAEPGDIILLLGKGHEDYQEIKGQKYHFDEREVVAEILQEMEASRSV